MNINITKAYYSRLIQGNHINRMPANIKNFEKTTPKEQNIWDICYKHPYPLNILCNFSPSFFKLNGIVINSMEGFLQSLKMKDAELQKKICQLPGILAKKLGNYLRKSTMYDGRSLHWQNQDFDRYSPIYHNLLKAAYAAKYDYDKSFRQIIKESRGRTLTHTIGKSSESETVLTEKEFIENLCILRNSKFNIGRFFIRKNRNALTISQNLPELKTSFVNSSIICGENVFTKGDALLKKLKKLGISNIIDIEQTTRSKNNAKSRS